MLVSVFVSHFPALRRPSSNDLYIVQQLINDSVSLLVYSGSEGEDEPEGEGNGQGSRSPGDGGEGESEGEGGGGGGAGRRRGPGELFGGHQGVFVFSFDRGSCWNRDSSPHRVLVILVDEISNICVRCG